MTEKIVYYINVGQLPPYRVEAYMERMKEQLNKNRTLNKDLEEYFIPVRDENTRIEVFTKSNKDEWIKENTLILETLQPTEIAAAQRNIEILRNKNYESTMLIKVSFTLAILTSLVCGFLACELINNLINATK
jgi:hypothetical protein